MITYDDFRVHICKTIDEANKYASKYARLDRYPWIIWWREPYYHIHAAHINPNDDEFATYLKIMEIEPGRP